MKNMEEVKNYIMNYNREAKSYELQAIYDSRKSFYSKAIVKEINNLKLLYSYNTLVCAIYENCYGVKYMLNLEIADNLLFSNTTLRHIKEFIKQSINSNINFTKKEIMQNNNKYLK